MKFLDKEWKRKNYKLYAQRDKNTLWIHFQGQTWAWKNQQSSEKKGKKDFRSKGLIVSALPGRIQKIFVKKADKVKRGQNLLILSAMKIEYSFKAEGEGLVEKVFCELDQTVESGQKLMKITYFPMEKESNG